MKDAEIQFECRTCQETPHSPETSEPPDWAQLAGFDSTCIQLCEVPDDKSQAIPLQLTHPFFLQTRPVVGSRYIAKVEHPFSASAGAPFWFLFQPPVSLHNGWEEDPKEIYESGLLRATFNEALQRDAKTALISVTIQDVLPIGGIHERFAESPNQSPLSLCNGDFFRTAEWCRYLNFVFVDWQLEGDVGVWWLLRQTDVYTSEPRFQLVLQGEWGWHEAFVWAGNRPLTNHEADQLNAFLMR